MINILTADLLSVEQLTRTTPPQNMERGREDYQAGRAAVESVEGRTAKIAVRDHRSGHPYQVMIWLHGSQVSLTCTCRENYMWYACRHRVAGFLALRDYLKAHPPKIWKAVLDQAGSTTERKPAANFGPIVFSLQQQGNSWVVVPYTLAARLFTTSALSDREAIAEVIDTLDLSTHAKALRSRVSRRAYPNATEREIAVANMAVNPYGSYGYAYNRENSYYETVLSFLPGCLVYGGDQGDPLQQRLEVLSEIGEVEATLTQTTRGLKIKAQVVAAARVLPLSKKTTSVVLSEPLWLLIDAPTTSQEYSTLVQVRAPGGLAAALIEYPELSIPKDDQDDFLEQHLLPLTERIQVRGDMVKWSDIDADPTPRLYLGEIGADKPGAAQELMAELRFDYGGYELAYEKRLPELSTRRTPGTTELARIKRRPELEQAAWQNLSSYGFKRGPEPHIFLLKKNVQPIEFLLHQVPRLAEAGYTVFGEEALTSARVNRNKPTISFDVSSGIDWFDVQAVVNYGELAVSLKDIRRAIRKREKYVKLADGTIGALPEEWIARYRHMLGLGEETADGSLRFSSAQITLLDQLLADADRARADEEFERRREKLRGFEQIEPKPLPAGFVGELRPYQKFGYDWLHFLREYGFGGCLADDMGVGKTIQALAFLLSLYEENPNLPATLIVMPRSLLFNWQREAERFTPNLKVYVHADQGRAGEAEQFGAHNLVLTTYGTMLRDVELLRKYEFHYAILDESQAIKNPLAETSKAARLLRARHRLVLTGTPIENSTTELWSQFAFLNPGLLGSVEYFREEFATPIERQGDADTAQFLRKMVYPFILRRTKDQVAADLPPRTERVIVSEMEPAQRKLYNKQRDYYRALLLGLIDDDGMNDARMKILEGLLRLRQICNHPKLVDTKFKGASGKFELLLDTLDTLRAEGHRALVFSQFVQMLTIIREALDARGIPYTYLDGQTRDRQGVVDRFQTDDTVPFFLISLKAGGVGLNLTAADYVIHVDPWWNPAVEMQATDRTHRIGQDKPVFVYKLVVKDSVEEKLLQLQDQKRALVEQVIGAEGGVFKSLTREDIEVLFT
jgi:non-specific serine/threonine protein kinase